MIRFAKTKRQTYRSQKRVNAFKNNNVKRLQRKTESGREGVGGKNGGVDLGQLIKRTPIRFKREMCCQQKIK